MATPAPATTGQATWLGPAVVLVATALVAWLGWRVASPALASWYPGLARPAVALPPALVLPAWLLVQLLTSLAAVLVLRVPDEDRAQGRALRAYWIQLALGLAWLAIFFGARDPGWAFVEALVLVATLAVTLLRFVAVDRRAGLLLLPCVLWGAHAALAGLLIWQANLKP